MKSWPAIAARIQQGFQSSTEKTSEFIAFAEAFKNFITQELKGSGAKLLSFSAGHFDISGFYEYKGRCGYFSLGDVRHCLVPRLMFRTAAHPKDHCGGYNQWSNLVTSEDQVGCTQAMLKGIEHR